MSMKIVAFGHRRYTGKNTAADFLFSAIKAADAKIKIFKGGFADVVKEESYNMFSWAGIHPAYYYEANSGSKEQIIPALGKSARDVWIHVGESMREISPVMWVELLFERVPKDSQYCLIYDLRKLPEADAIKRRGGICVEMLRDVEKYNDPVDSELKDWDGWDHHIDNNGTRHDLMAKMGYLSSLLKGQ